jgi:hypothetical protein
MKQFVQKGRCFIKISLTFLLTLTHWTYPLKTPNLIARKKEEKSSLEEGQRQARRQQQQLLRNFSTPSKRAHQHAHYPSLLSVSVSLSKSVYSDPTK